MTAFDPSDKEVLAALEADYWHTVEATLQVVFDASPDVASRYRERLAQAPPLQRALALHDDPLDLATTLVGKEPSAEQVEQYDKFISHYPDRALFDDRAFEAGDDVLSSARRDERSSMIPVKLLNRFLGDLGYHPLRVVAGIAYFALRREAWKRPLLKYLRMETPPGLDADRVEVYPLYRVMAIFDALREFAERRRPTSSFIGRIERTRGRLLRALGTRTRQ
jgi:hypothetical protein